MDNYWFVQLAVGSAIALFTWYLRSSVETIRRERERLQGDRRAIYLQVLDPFIRILAGLSDPSEQQEVLGQIASVDYRRTFYELNFMGSDDVILAMNDLLQFFFRAEREGTKPEPRSVLDLWGSVLLAIRKDLGIRNTKLSSYRHAKRPDQRHRSNHRDPTYPLTA